MALSLIFILFPGIIAVAVANRLSGYSTQPLNKSLIDLTLHSAIVVFSYTILALIPFLHLPQPAELAQLALPMFSEKTNDGNTIREFAEKADRAIITSFLIALVSGFVTALERELKLIRRLGARFSVFQHNAIETAWHDAFAEAGPESWIHIDTKDGRRFTGLIYAASWDCDKGGICLKKVHLWDEVEEKIKPVADWIYLRTEDLSGPVIFTKPDGANSHEQ